MTVLMIEDVRIELYKKRVRRLNLHVTPERVWMSAPHHMSAREAEVFVRSHLDWIRAQQRACSERSAFGDIVPLWGEQTRLRYIEGTGKAALMEGELTLFVSPGSGDMEKRAALDLFYRGALQANLPEVCAKWEAVTGQRANEYRLRAMKTRWGTCSIHIRRVWLNIRLAEYPPECLDYVIVHELTHLIVPNHSEAFWQHVDMFYPNWRAVRARLKRGGLSS